MVAENRAVMLDRTESDIALSVRAATLEFKIGGGNAALPLPPSLGRYRQLQPFFCNPQQARVLSMPRHTGEWKSPQGGPRQTENGPSRGKLGPSFLGRQAAENASGIATCDHKH